MTTSSHFRLIGRETVFRVVRRFDAAGHIPSIEGETLDGTHRTVARVEDVIFIEPRKPDGAEAVCERIITNNPAPLSPMLAIYDTSPSRFKRMAAQHIMSHRRNVEFLRSRGRVRLGYNSTWLQKAAACRMRAAGKLAKPTIRVCPYGFTGPEWEG